MILPVRHLAKSVASLLLVVWLPAHAAEKEVVLGFDGLPEFSLDVGDFGVSFTGAAVLTCGGSLNCGPFPPFSGDNVIFDNFGSGGVITATFDTLTTGRITRVTARVTGNTNVTLTAFGDQATVLDTDETGGANFVGSGTGIPANKLLTVESETGLIKRVVFRDSGNTYTVDNFAFVGFSRKVVIDPGHGKIGGQFQRPPSANFGIIEDELTLDIAKKLELFLQNEGISTVLTRTGDAAPFATPNCVLPCMIDIRKRVRFAEMQEPDILVSIHTNAAAAPTANGTETFYSPSAPSDDAMSISLAQKIHDNLVFLAGLRDRGVKTEKWTVLQSSIVSVLTEVAFHSNTQLAAGQTVTDEEQLSQDAFRDFAATTIGLGVIDYFEEIEEAP